MDTTLLRFLWHFARQSAALIWTVALMGGVMAALDLITPMAIGKVFQLLASGAFERGTWVASRPILLTLAVLMLVVRPVLQFAHNRLLHIGMQCGFSSLVRWQSNLQVLRRNLPFFQQELSGRIASHVLRVGPALTNALVQGMSMAWQLLIVIGLSMALLASGHWMLSLPMVCWLALNAMLLSITLPRIRQSTSISNDRLSRLAALIVDVYSNMATVIAFGRVPTELDAIRQANRAYDQAQRQHMSTTTIQGLVQSALTAAMVVGTAAIGIALLLEHRLGAGDLAIAIPLAWQAGSVSSFVMNQLSSLIENMGVARDAMSSVAPVACDALALDLPKLRWTQGEICFDAVNFAYRDGLGVIRDFNLVVRPGERVGLVGASGSGKSTLLSLLLCTLKPSSGRILIDGQDMSTLDPDSVREVIGYVPQDTSLFHRSIFDNIAYGRRGASLADVQQAAQSAEATGFIDKHVDWLGRSGYDAHVGDRGAQLSGGQRQRLAIARAILKDAPVLVLDEATNALDAETEAAIQKELSQLMAGKTVLAIAHRLSTIAQLDRLIVIDDGVIVEEGTHASLLARGGRYTSLWNQQRANFL